MAAGLLRGRALRALLVSRGSGCVRLRSSSLSLAARRRVGAAAVAPTEPPVRVEGRLALFPVDDALGGGDGLRAAARQRRSPPSWRRWPPRAPSDQKRDRRVPPRTGLDRCTQIDSIAGRIPRGGAPARRDRASSCAPSAWTSRGWSPTCATRCKSAATIWCRAARAPHAVGHAQGPVASPASSSTSTRSCSARGGWAQRMADLADGAAGERQRRRPTSSWSSWHDARRPATQSGRGAIVSVERAASCSRTRRLKSAASVMRMSLGINLGTGLEAGGLTADRRPVGGQGAGGQGQRDRAGRQARPAAC